jgi:hypothetical protein
LGSTEGAKRLEMGQLEELVAQRFRGAEPIPYGRPFLKSL